MCIPHKTTVLLLCGLILAACGSEPAIYNRESFASDSPFKLDVEPAAATACDAARRALLGQGYLIEKADAEQVKGRKAYRSEGDQNTFIEVNVVCVGEDVGSTLFANGVLSTYDLKKSSSPASVGVSAIGSISLPIGRSADSLVKIAEETIDDPAFYKRFFGAVTNALQGMRARVRPPEGPSAPATESPATPAAAASPSPAPPPAAPSAALTSRPATPGGLAVEMLPGAPAAQSTATSQTAPPVQPAEAPASAAPEPVAGPGTPEEPEPEPLF